jgi:hypothetical protein
MGPAFDGGYYLIGFREDTFLPEAFQGISWGTGGVFQETMAILNEAGRDVHVLERWGDVDTLDDLKELVYRNRVGGGDLGTLSYLHNEVLI